VSPRRLAAPGYSASDFFRLDKRTALFPCSKQPLEVAELPFFVLDFFGSPKAFGSKSSYRIRDVPSLLFAEYCGLVLSVWPSFDLCRSLYIHKTRCKRKTNRRDN
jgi:hypothetical protein